MLNETQKQNLDATIEYILDDINEAPTEVAIIAFNAIKQIIDSNDNNRSIFEENKNLFDNLNVVNDGENRITLLNSIEQLINIVTHEFPQNRTTNYPYFGAPADPEIIVYKNADGTASFERKGILQLTPYNDNTCAEVTRGDVVRHISATIEVQLRILEQKRRADEFESKVEEVEIKLEYATRALEAFNNDSQDHLAQINKLFNIVIRGSIEDLKKQLCKISDLGISLSCKNQDDKTILDIAMEDGRFDIFETIKAHQEFLGKELLEATKNKKFNKALELIRSGANINEKDAEGYTALMYVARFGNLLLTRELIARGANVRTSNVRGESIIGWAAFGGYEEICAALLEAGATVKSHNEFGMTALMSAVQRGSNPNIVKMLIDAGSDIYKKDFLDQKSALQVAKELGDQHNPGGDNPILRLLQEREKLDLDSREIKDEVKDMKDDSGRDQKHPVAHEDVSVSVANNINDDDNAEDEILLARVIEESLNSVASRSSQSQQSQQSESLIISANQEVIHKLNQAKIFFHLKEEIGFKGNNLFYLDIKPDIKNLIENNHLDYNGENILTEVSNFLKNSPDAIKSVSITGLTQEELQNINIHLPNNDNSVISYLSKWIEHGFGKAEKPGNYPVNVEEKKQQNISGNSQNPAIAIHLPSTSTSSPSSSPTQPQAQQQNREEKKCAVM